MRKRLLRSKRTIKYMAAFLGALFLLAALWGNYALTSYAEESAPLPAYSGSQYSVYKFLGGGYAATGQIGGVGYATQIYDATNGLPTSDANFILSSRDGYIWIGTYSGIFKYDGSVFEKITSFDGLTSGRCLLEDSKGRMWVGTNDNGIVVIDGGRKATWITYKDGLPSSSIRDFAEDNNGNVYIGTTSGICYADESLNISVIDDSRINEERILKLDSDKTGVIYGQTRNGKIFSVSEKLITHVYDSADLEMDNRISTILVDPDNVGCLYIGTEGGEVYHGRFGSKTGEMKHISLAPLQGVHWLSYDCGRIWASSISQTGYLDKGDSFKLIKDIPLNSGIEMMTSDYQGNMWYASSTQGVMKLVTSNFIDLSKKTDLKEEVTNSTCMVGDTLYIGTDNGLRILDGNNRVVENKLTKYIGATRVRCLMKDKSDNLWISTFTNNLGLVCYSKAGEITAYNKQKGMPSDEIRCTTLAKDGSVLAGTNGGLAIIKGGEIKRVVGASDGIKNTVFMTLEEADNGVIYAGTDGDGIYEINGAKIRRLGRDDGLTSDVILRIKKDEKRDLVWIITSNSVEYLKDDTLTAVSSFPYSNNYDLFFNKNDDMWIVSSYGIYMVNVDEMVRDEVSEYKLYTLANGVTSTPTANSFSELDERGNLYLSGRSGVCKANIDLFFEKDTTVKTGLKVAFAGDKILLPDKNGIYTIPPSGGRVKITVSILDYSLTDPPIRIYMEGEEKDGILEARSKLPALEYTGMSHGNHVLHVQVLDSTKKSVIQEETFVINKQASFSELIIIRVLLFILTGLLAGFIVWRVMKNTVIRHQYDEIRQARDDAERANSAKTRFLANISHEIRTPINTILGMDEMIMREDPTNVPKGYFMSMMNYAFDIRNASETLLGLINDLLDMTKIESGKMHLVEMEYDVQELLRSIVSMIRVKSTEKELMFDVVVDEILPTRLYGDAGKIKQVVLNLLTNAVKYTDKGCVILSVTVDERKDDDLKISFSVKDTGIGVRQEDMDKLFTAYERLDEEKNSGIQGTGLGLDISRRFSELMGGSLTCDSVYGKGSEFILSLHQKIVDPTPIGLFTEHDENAAAGPYVPKFIAPDADVLVVDDTPMNLSVIKGLLKATRIFVTTAGSGEECLEKMKTTKFNVVLLDHMMPGMDGIETVARIRQTDPDIPVYALTANATAGEEFYKSKGFTGYLAKPIDSAALESAIMKHLPEEIMLKPEAADIVEEPESIPEELMWIYDTEGIDVEEGIKNSGGISSFISSLKLFLDTIDGNSKIISDAYETEDIRLYTIKVHALKSSARIIGAMALSKLAESLEDAGNKENTDFIELHTQELLTDYAEYKTKLSRLDSGAVDDSGKEEIPPEELEDAYGALREVIPQMDYDSVEMILDDLKQYKLPKKDTEKMVQLAKILKTLDWEAMEELVKE